MILLDTSVLSALMLARPDPIVVAWLDTQPPESVWTTAVTVFEIRFGIEILPAGRRRKAIEKAFADMLRDDLDGRVASFDVEAATAAAELAARRQRHGQPVELRDTQIAGIALARRATLATRNVRHFQGLAVSVVSPWEARRRDIVSRASRGNVRHGR